MRAKFKVNSVIHTENGSELVLTPVTSGGKENEEFFKYTPYGELKMGVVNSDIVKGMTPGKEFYLDFTPV
jgi:hypothetical protein